MPSFCTEYDHGTLKEITMRRQCPLCRLVIGGLLQDPSAVVDGEEHAINLLPFRDHGINKRLEASEKTTAGLLECTVGTASHEDSTFVWSMHSKSA
ncbi:hypothetical protein SUNI508_06268 [Seiridium unicorne]|uniref:Uncharacterized protein n=1 Tax=Seiridium unicorne TaxID=138068 RepID=A0ABR2V0R5_9PEZI